MDVTVVGSCMTDLISYVPELPQPGETVHGTKFIMGFGGKGANQAVMSAKLGAKTALVAKLGQDTFGDNYMTNLEAVGVDTTHTGRVPGASGVATITVDEHAENCIVIAAGANNSLCEADIVQAKELLLSSKVVLFQMEVPLATNIAALRLIKQHHPHITTVFNAAPATDTLPEEVYPLVDVFCVNESEAEKLLHLDCVRSVEEAGRAAGLLCEKGCGTGMVTLGAGGVVYKQGGERTHVKCPVVKAVDTTGAGDAFIGALAYLIADKNPGYSMERKVEIACSVASNSVTKLGTQTSYPTSYEK